MCFVFLYGCIFCIFLKVFFHHLRSMQCSREDSRMYGFLDGPHGVFSGNFVVITDEIMDGFRNTGAPRGDCHHLLSFTLKHQK